MKTSTLVCAAFMAFGSLFVGSSSALLPPFAYTAAQAFVGKAILFYCCCQVVWQIRTLGIKIFLFHISINLFRS